MELTRATLATLAAVALVAAGTGCHTRPGETDRMDLPTVEIIAKAPWSADLPHVAIALPQRGDVAGVETWSAPALPMIRVSASGEVAVLNYTDRGFGSAGAVAWTAPTAAGPLRWHRAPDPFAGQAGAVTAVDFWVEPAGALVLLEKVGVDGVDGVERSRLARLAVDGEPTTHELDGVFVRVVVDDAGRVYLVRHAGGGALVPVEPATGTLGTAIEIAPGSALALAANRGAAVPERLLKAPSATKVTAGAGLPQSLVFMVGVDAQSNYVAVVDGELARIGFDGRVLQRVALASLPGIVPPATGPVRPRVAPPSAWQVDAAGRVVLVRGDAAGFELVRLTLAK